MGLYPALVVLGIYDRCTPKLASDASRAVAMLSSLAEAQAQLRSDGIALDIKTLRSTAYRYAARARAVQQSAACGLLDRVTGKRVVVSLDGGRVRVRRKKRGPKTKKGRNRFHTDWKEPKLLILYVVGDDGRPSQTWAPIIDGTLRGPEAVFALLLSYARQIGLNAADKVLFIADGAPWIWQRIQRLIAALGLSPTQVLGLIDFYHAAKQLSDAVKLRRWSATQRTRWLNRTRGLLKRARVDEVITALRELCRGRTAGKIRTHLNYFLKNRHRFAYTFRLTLSAILAGPLNLGVAKPGRLLPEDNRRVSTWIKENLRVAITAWPERDTLKATEHKVLKRIDPPLNIDGQPETPFREHLTKLRCAISSVQM